MNNIERKCLECGTTIFGRKDKKFCSDQCRNLYNNELNSDSHNLVRNINNILRRNRRILESLNTGTKKIVNKDQLLQSGFNFYYYTNTYTTKTGKTYFYCYDQGYLPMEHNQYMLVVKEEYVK